MTHALSCFDAYVARQKGPPGRAECKALSDRLRLLEPLLSAAQRLEREVGVELDSARSQAESYGVELSRLQRENAALTEQAAHVDAQLSAATAPPLCASFVQLMGVFVISAWGGWLAHG